MSPAQIPEQIPVGALACQKDTFLKSFSTRCIACSEKPDKKGFYEVLLHDTSRCSDRHHPDTLHPGLICSFVSLVS